MEVAYGTAVVELQRLSLSVHENHPNFCSINRKRQEMNVCCINFAEFLLQIFPSNFSCLFGGFLLVSHMCVSFRAYLRTWSSSILINLRLLTHSLFIWCMTSDLFHFHQLIFFYYFKRMIHSDIRGSKLNRILHVCCTWRYQKIIVWLISGLFHCWQK